MDESGDLEFDNPRASKHFVVTFLCCHNESTVEHIIKKTRQKIKPKSKKYRGALHAYHEKPSTRSKLLQMVSTSQDCKIITIVFDKNTYFADRSISTHVLYATITNILLEKLIIDKIIEIDHNTQLIASQRETNKFLNNQFSKLVQDRIKHKFDINMQVLIQNHSSHKGLQVVDFTSRAIFKKYEQNNSSYYSIIKNSIIGEYDAF